ncbi:MAG: hypothetical protein IPN19_09505 [Elusimicrobia bacterium]|jgi:hypothetical protein|nr:hypothetical protein [Elusimicrobiota bacterium]
MKRPPISILTSFLVFAVLANPQGVSVPMTVFSMVGPVDYGLAVKSL